MKVRELTRLMGDMGTKPRVKVIKHMVNCGFCGMLVYEGHPDGVGVEIGKLKINSFTAQGKGLLVIHAE